MLHSNITYTQYNIGLCGTGKRQVKNWQALGILCAMGRGSHLVDLRTMRNFAQVDDFITVLTSRGKLGPLTRMARNVCFKGRKIVTTSRTQGHKGEKGSSFRIIYYTHTSCLAFSLPYCITVTFIGVVIVLVSCLWN
jgi:hypothetical protein